ncbi:MAG: hypothetical protein HZA51_17900 [Planctomycetes bacterium]|nr:hypothetical protein [Planctomycetota bacterium]
MSEPVAQKDSEQHAQESIIGILQRLDTDAEYRSKLPELLWANLPNKADNLKARLKQLDPKLTYEELRKLASAVGISDDAFRVAIGELKASLRVVEDVAFKTWLYRINRTFVAPNKVDDDGQPRPFALGNPFRGNADPETVQAVQKHLPGWDGCNWSAVRPVLQELGLSAEEIARLTVLDVRMQFAVRQKSITLKLGGQVNTHDATIVTSDIPTGPIAALYDALDCAYQASTKRPGSEPGIPTWDELEQKKQLAMAHAELVGKAEIVIPLIVDAYKALASLWEIEKLGHNAGSEKHGQFRILFDKLRELRYLDRLPSIRQANTHTATIIPGEKPYGVIETPSKVGAKLTNADKPRNRRWTQANLDAEISQYLIENKRQVANAEQAIKSNAKDGIKKARRLIGRNTLARHFKCPGAMVSSSRPWKAIAAKLGINGNKPGTGRGERMGLDIAAEEKSDAEYRQLLHEHQAEMESEKRMPYGRSQRD